MVKVLSAERHSFLSDVLKVFAERGAQIGGIGRVEASEQDSHRYRSVVVRYLGAGQRYRVTPEVLDSGLTKVRTRDRIRYLSNPNRRAILAADRDNNADLIDPVLATCIVEIALFDEVVYC